MREIKNHEQTLINNTAEDCKRILLGEGSGHDWWHTYRVWKVASTICKQENADPVIVQLSALLHDVEDWKSNQGSEKKAISHASEFLRAQELDQQRIDHICHIIQAISFKGINTSSKPETIEGQIVQDADRLDAIGATGIARVFTYGGHTNRTIYDPTIRPAIFASKEAYLNNKGTSVNHFYEKLLLLKDLMNTKTAKELARERHNFLEKYLEQFYSEWDGLK